jgi:hypothetical protein
MAHEEKNKCLREERDATFFLLVLFTAVSLSALLSFLLHKSGPVPAKIAFICLFVVAAYGVFFLVRKGLTLRREEAQAPAKIAVKTLTGPQDE